jgi:arsenate reductase
MTTNILILCTHNSARSVLAEGMLNHWAKRLGKDVRGFSAGSSPSGRVNPFTLGALEAAGVDTTGYRSKCWDEFAAAGAPPLRVVITVCDSAAAEACPYWPGSPVTVHWGYPDPSNAPEDERAAAFEQTRQSISDRMRRLVELPFDRLSDADVERSLKAMAEG